MFAYRDNISARGYKRLLTMVAFGKTTSGLKGDLLFNSHIFGLF